MTAKRQKLFSDSWHLVASRYAVLRPVVEARRQMFRGEPWYVLYDPLRQEYYRLTEAAYAFVVQLSRTRTIEQVWRSCMEQNPDNTPVQDEVIQILAQLNQSNLLDTDLPQDAARLYETRMKTREKKVRTQLLNFLFLRVPLFNPDPFLKPLGKLFRPLCSMWGLLLWIGIMVWGGFLWVENLGDFISQRQGLLARENLFWLFVATVLLKALHELGHGIVCRALGGPVYRFGLLFLIFVPLPYVDASSSWSFPSKWRRIAVASAGMMVELALAVIALWVWSTTGDAAIRSLAYNIVVVASVGTLLFNINPLLKFDGYYILTDWLGVPNLQQRAQRQLIHTAERYVFGVKESKSQGRSLGEATFLFVYGIAAFVYRIVLMVLIALMVAEQYFEIGMALAILIVTTSVIIPLGKFIHYLAFSARLDGLRSGAVITVSMVLLLLVSLLVALPYEQRFTAPGVVQGSSETYVYSRAGGRLVEVVTASGTWVEQGTVLARLEDPELDLTIRIVESSIAQWEYYYQIAQRQNITALDMWVGTLEKERENLALLLADRENLILRASVAGIWFSPEMTHRLGLRVQRGEELGKLIGTGKAKFMAVVSQTEATHIFEGSPRDATVRLKGRSGIPFPAEIVSVSEAGRRVLPSSALGVAGGGEILTTEGDNSGTIASEAFFEIQLNVHELPDEPFFSGQLGRVRIVTGETTLGGMVWRSIRQTMQKRLQL